MLDFCSKSLATIVVIVLAMTVGTGVVAQEPDGKASDVPSTPNERQSTDDELGQAEPLTPEQLKAIRIDANHVGPIFVYDQSGGFRRVAPGAKKPTPMFQLFADGRVVSRGSNFETGDIETKLTDAELNRFLNWVVNKNAFYKIDTDAIKKQMNSGMQPPQIMDAPTARFSLNLLKGKKDVDVYALFHVARVFPKIKELHQLARIEKHCNQIVSGIHLEDDGPEVLKVVNAAIAREKPDFAPVAMKELRLATRSGNGRFQVSFERELPTHDGGPGRKANVIYFRASQDAKPIVTFYGFPQK